KQEATGKHSSEFPNMAQRTIKPRRLEDRRSPSIPAGELMLSRIRNYVGIEIRGEKQHTAIKLTPAGHKAMRSAIETTRRLVRGRRRRRNERNGQTSGIR